MMTHSKYLAALRLGAAAISGMLAGSCQQNTRPETVATPATTIAVAPELPAAVRASAEYLDWETATINGTLPLLGKTVDLFKLLGKPDSLVTPDMNDICVSYFDSQFQDAYFKQSNWEIHGDTAVVRILVFRDNPKIALHTPALLLSQATTLAELARHFPEAVKARGTMNVQNWGKLTAVNLNTGKTASDDSWILFFEGNKLVRIDYWMPC